MAVDSQRLLNDAFPSGKDKTFTELGSLLAKQREKLSALGVCTPNNNVEDIHLAHPTLLQQFRPSTQQQNTPPRQSCSVQDQGFSQLDCVNQANPRPCEKNLLIDDCELPAKDEKKTQPSEKSGAIHEPHLSYFVAANLPRTFTPKDGAKNTEEAPQKLSRSCGINVRLCTKNHAKVLCKGAAELGNEVQKIIKNIKEKQSFSDASVTFDDPLNYIDVAAKNIGSEATVRVLKAKVRSKETELDQVTQQANKSVELASKRSAELQQLQQEYRTLKARQVLQDVLLKKCINQKNEARKLMLALTNEMERACAELTDKKRQYTERPIKPISDSAMLRLETANEKMTSELQALKINNSTLSQLRQKLQLEIHKERQRHHKNLLKLVLVVEKQEQLMHTMRKQCDLSERIQVTRFKEQEFRRYFREGGAWNAPS